MMLHIPEVLTQDQVLDCRRLLQQAPWADGKSTAGFQSAMAKDNLVEKAKVRDNQDKVRVTLAVELKLEIYQILQTFTIGMVLQKKKICLKQLRIL